jgi:hypothetical protein
MQRERRSWRAPATVSAAGDVRHPRGDEFAQTPSINFPEPAAIAAARVTIRRLRQASSSG